METCPCGIDKTYQECCGSLIEGERSAETAEALMRSRYTAFVKGEIDYILKSVHPEKRKDHDEKSIRDWSRRARWHGLEILETRDGGTEDVEGSVEFVAHFSEKKDRVRHHESARFKKEDGVWYFWDGEGIKPQQFRREGPKVGRNEPCPCGSGKKYKKCCGRV